MLSWSNFSAPMFLFTILKSISGILVDIAIIFVAIKAIPALKVYVRKNG